MFDLQGLATYPGEQQGRTREPRQKLSQGKSQPCTVCNWALKPWTRRVGKDRYRNLVQRAQKIQVDDCEILQQFACGEHTEICRNCCEKIDRTMLKIESLKSTKAGPATLANLTRRVELAPNQIQSGPQEEKTIAVSDANDASLAAENAADVTNAGDVESVGEDACDFNVLPHGSHLGIGLAYDAKRSYFGRW